jgi:hypothetical protein
LSGRRCRLFAALDGRRADGVFGPDHFLLGNTPIGSFPAADVGFSEHLESNAKPPPGNSTSWIPFVASLSPVGAMLCTCERLSGAERTVETRFRPFQCQWFGTCGTLGTASVCVEKPLFEMQEWGASAIGWKTQTLNAGKCE